MGKALLSEALPQTPINHRDSYCMVVTNTLLERIKTINGGYTKIQAEALGLSWPLITGWKKQVIGKRILNWRILFEERNKSTPIKKTKTKKDNKQKKTGRFNFKNNPNRKLDLTYIDTWVRRNSNLDITYSDFLKSDYWEQVKQKARLRSDTYGKCQFCNSNNKIELHHTSYKWIKTKDELRNVIPLCREHHQEVHNYAKEKNVSVRIATNNVRKKYKATL